MAKQTVGFMGGFQGTLGPAVGYMWNGKWCVRSRPGAVRNPRTPAQVAHREMFKREVQLAANMRWAVENTMRELARQEGMTCFNLFVKVNQHAFSLVERDLSGANQPNEGGMDKNQPNEGGMGVFTVDYSALRLSMGDVAPVENARVERRDGRVLEVVFDKGHGFSHDHVHMFVYAPGLERGLMSLPVFRRDKKVAMMLPDRYVDEELHIYLMVHTDDGQWSESVYVCGQPTLENGELNELSELDGKCLKNGELRELGELDSNSHNMNNSPLKEAPPE